MARVTALFMIGLVALSPVACKRQSGGLTKEEAAGLASDAEKLYDAASGEEGFLGAPSDIGFTSKYASEFRELVQLAQKIDGEFSTEMETYHPEYYFEPARLADEAARSEFRGEIARYRKAIIKYEIDMNGYYDRAREIAEKIDGKKYPSMNIELRAMMSKMMAKFDDTAVSYLAVLDHLDRHRPTHDETGLVFEQDSAYERYVELIDEASANEELGIKYAEEFETMRQAALQKARGQLNELK